MSENTVFVVTRPINGISINGKETLLDSIGRPREFATREQAEGFMSAAGLSPEDYEIEVWK